ncbi:MAG: hypothetical protein ACT4PM_09445 [Gemmatimonadales bacterium]
MTDREELSLLAVAAGLLRHRRRIIGAALGLGLLAAIVTVVRPRQYLANASFIAQVRSTNAALSGVAAQFGVTVTPVEPGQSPSFYADLLRSRELLSALATSRFPPAAGDSATLLEILGIGGATPALQVERAVARLRRRLEVSIAARTGVVSLGLAAPTPELAQQVTARLLELLNQFNVSTRRSQASEERRFTEQRLREVMDELRQAEDRLVVFTQQNRDIRSSPRLQAEFARLERQVLLRQQVVIQLSQAAEQAKIEAVRDTPVLTVIERPVVPARAASRRLVAWIGFGLVVGGVLGLLWAVWADNLQRARAADSQAYRDYRQALARS